MVPLEPAANDTDESGDTIDVRGCAADGSALHVRPASALRSITPPSPTATTIVGVTKETPRSVWAVPETGLVHVAPPLAVRRILPAPPTATASWVPTPST